MTEKRRLQRASGLARTSGQDAGTATSKVVKMRKPADGSGASGASGGRSPKAASQLAPGLHAAHIEMGAKSSYRVRLTTGEIVAARLAPGVEKAFVEECLRARRTVLVSGGADGEPVILGALQTARSVERDAQDTLRLGGRRVELRADESVSIQVGGATMTMDKGGAVRLAGNKLTMDIAEVVRVLSALVELP